MVAASRSGNRNRAMAAPWARSPPSMPLMYAQVARTWVSSWVRPG